MLGLSSLSSKVLATDKGNPAAAAAVPGAELLRISCSVHAREQRDDLLELTCNVFRKVDSGG